MSLGLTLLSLIIFLFAVGLNSNMVNSLAEELGGVPDGLSDEDMNKGNGWG